MKILTGNVPDFNNNKNENLDPALISAAIAPMQDIADEEYIGHLAAIVESCDDAIISKSLDGIIKSWNRAAEKIFGYTAKQAVGNHISLIIPPAYIEEEKNILIRIRNNEFIEHYETIRRRKNGEQFYTTLTVSPLKDRAGNIIGVSKIARDVTSRKNAETALAHSNKELAFQKAEKENRTAELIIAIKELTFQNEEKEHRATELAIANKELVFQNKEKENRSEELLTANKYLKISEDQFREVNNELESFSYSVSHDLRAPLRAVIGYTRMLKGKYETQLDAEAKRLMSNITMNAAKMGQLIDDLLSFSRVGRKELVRVKIPMEDTVKNICAELKIEQGDRNIDYNIQKLPTAEADYTTIKQVWLNLISNAIKYTKNKEKAIIEIGSKIKENEITYYIKDNGAGFDMRYADKLFGVFQRLHSDEEFEGTGVGLALVQRIIFKHCGKVWAEGKVDEGATFYFTLNKC